MHLLIKNKFIMLNINKLKKDLFIKAQNNLELIVAYHRGIRYANMLKDKLQYIYYQQDTQEKMKKSDDNCVLWEGKTEPWDLKPDTTGIPHSKPHFGRLDERAPIIFLNSDWEGKSDIVKDL